MTAAETLEQADGGAGQGHEDQHGRGDGDGQSLGAAQGQGLGHQFADHHVEVGDEGEAEGDGDDVGVDAGVGQSAPSQPMRMEAASGSPIQPRASEQRVTPSWTAGRKSSRSRCRRRTARAPGTPAASICSMRVSRMETRANSAATKKALARMSMATATNWSSERPCIWVRG